MIPIHTTPMADHKHAPFALPLACRALVLALLVSTPAIAQTAKDTVRWDERAGQWVYTLFNPSNQSRSKEVRYTPRTLIEPMVKSKLQRNNDLYEYSYRVKNGASARQPISDISVLAPKWDAEAIKHAPLQPNMTWPQIQTKARAEVAAEEAFVAKTLYSPNRWKPFLNVNSPTRVAFGWLVDYQKGYAGIAPSTAQGSFSVLRAELPGAGWMALQGDTPDLYNAPTLPSAGALADQVADVLAQDSVYVPVLVPAIVVPTPYGSAELVRRIRAHVTSWVESGLMDAELLSAMGPPFEQLLNATTTQDKKAARAAVREIFVLAFTPHPGMTHANTDDDGDNDSKADKRMTLGALGGLVAVTEPAVPLQRVAARALVFDLRYLLARM
jgi:hypothetical protein